MEKIVYEAVYRGEAYYWKRVDRNVGWITREEQKVLRSSVVGIAGTGGMGGLISAVLLRVGIGEIRIADKETFDLSNMNRQFAARRATVGKNKAEATAHELRRITDDAKIVVYPQGICGETVDDFVMGCDLVLDKIEFFAIGARILLHMRARKAHIPLINCDTVGFSTNLFFFTPTGMTVEELLGVSYEEACSLEVEVKKGSKEARQKIIEMILRTFSPEIPEYKTGEKEVLIRRLFEEKKASIIGSNPPFATGFVADRAVLYLLKKAGLVKRDIVDMPEAPGYLFFDAAKMEAKVVPGRTIC